MVTRISLPTMSKSSYPFSLSPPAMDNNWKVAFDEYCKSTFIEETQLYHETVCKEIGDRVMHLLKGKPDPSMDQDPFYVWVKSKGFALTSYPLLGLREVLCVPSSNSDSVSYCIFLKSVKYTHVHVCKFFMHTCTCSYSSGTSVLNYVLIMDFLNRITPYVYIRVSGT